MFKQRLRRFLAEFGSFVWASDSQYEFRMSGNNHASGLHGKIDSHFLKLGTQAGGVISPRKWNTQKRQLIPREDLVDEAVACNAFRAGVGAVVQFDPAQDPAGGGVRDDEVNMLADDLVERGLLALAIRGIEQIGEADLGGEMIGRVDKRLENIEECKFGGCQQVVSPLNQVDGIAR